MEKNEWIRRYKEYLKKAGGLTEKQAETCIKHQTFECLSQGFEDDPEGAAIEEMSYWEP